MADELEHLGAIGRVRDPQDRRKSTLEITDSGRALLTVCTRAIQEVDDELLSDVSRADRKALQRILADVLGSSAEAVPKGP